MSPRWLVWSASVTSQGSFRSNATDLVERETLRSASVLVPHSPQPARRHRSLRGLLLGLLHGGRLGVEDLDHSSIGPRPSQLSPRTHAHTHVPSASLRRRRLSILHRESFFSLSLSVEADPTRAGGRAAMVLFLISFLPSVLPSHGSANLTAPLQFDH